jgi:hypothetical protein
MPRKYIPAFFIYLGVLLTCKTLLANCLVKPEPQAKEATNIKPKQGKSFELNDKRELPDCSQLMLISGMIHVLYLDPEGLKHVYCKDAGKLCPVDVAGTWPSAGDSTNTHTGFAGKKMDETVSRLAGIPYGKIFSPERAATFNMAKAGLTQWNLTLLDATNKKPIHRQSGSAPVIQIPVHLLRPGGKYTLLIDAGNQKYKGGFDILGGAQAQDIADQIKQLSNDNSATELSRKLDELIILYENNLDYEVEYLREELNL